MPVGDSVGVLVGVLFGDVRSVLYVVVIGVSLGALALKKLAKAFLLSCHDVFAELFAACASHRLLLLSVSHSPGRHYMVVSRWCPSGVRVAVVSRSCPGGVPVLSQ